MWSRRWLFVYAVLTGCADPRGTLSVADDATTDTQTAPTVPVTPPTGTVTSPDGEISGLIAAVHPTYGSVGVVTWDQAVPADVHLEFSFEEGVWRSSPTDSRAPGPQSELIVGVPFGAEVTWRLVAAGADGFAYTSPDAALQLGDLPNAVPDASVKVADPAAFDDVAAPYWLVGVAEDNQFTDPWWVLIVDREGRTLWADRSPNNRVSFHSRVARDGKSLLLDRNSYWPLFDDGDASTIERMLLDGTVLHTYPTPGLHHPFTDLPDGSIAYGATTGGYDNEFLAIVHDDGTEELIFDCGAWLDDLGVNDFCMSNTLAYHEATNTFLFSMFSLDSVLEVDRATGEVNRTFGHLPGSYDFDPPGSAFWWQHGVHVTDAGTLLVSTDLNPDGVETIVREYAIDAPAQTLHQVWTFGIGDGVYGHQMGEAQRLPNGNTSQNYGEVARIREATADGTVVWDISWDSDAIGRTMPIADLYALTPRPSSSATAP